MKALVLALLILFLIPPLPTPVNAVSTIQAPTPILQTVQKVHTVTPGQLGQDLGSNTLQTTPKAFSFYRSGGNFSIGAVALTVGGQSITVSNPSAGLFPQGLSNSTITEYLYDQSVVILTNTYHAHVEFYLKDIAGSYNREIILKGSGDVNGVADSGGTLFIQFSNPQSLAVSQCDMTAQPGINGNTFLCQQQLFGNMGMDWSKSPYPTSYNNSTQTLSYTVPASFVIDPIALDGSGKAGTCALASTLTASLTTTNSNDVIIAYVATTSGSSPYPITVSGGGLTWTLRKSYAPVILGSETVDEYYAIASSTLSGASITAALSATSFESLTVFGVSGANTGTPFDSNGALPSVNNNHLFMNGVTHDHEFFPNVLVSTSNANDFIFDMATIGNCVTYTPSMVYTLIQNPPTSGSQYIIVSSTQTNLNVSATINLQSYWVAVGDAIQKGAQVTQPIKITVDNSGASATFAITNCSPSPATIVTDGATHNILADLSCTMTITVSADGANTRYRYSGGGTTTTVATCASGTCSLVSITVFEELQNTYQATPVGPTVWDAVYSIPVTGTIAGAASTTGCSIATTSGGGAANCQTWFDYNRQVTVSASFGSWSPFPAGSNTFTQTTGGNTNNVNYIIASSAQETLDVFPLFGLAMILVIWTVMPERRRR